MKTLRRVLQSLAVSLPLLLGPLGAQESPPDAPQPEAAEPAKQLPDASAEKPAAAVPPAGAEEDAGNDAGPEENVSADNSLSFPVDI